MAAPPPARCVALVREPGPRLADCELTHVSRAPIDVAVARAQHAAYCGVLQGQGVAIEWLPPLDDCPDGVFVEDAAVVLPEVAVLCRPGARSRRAEIASVGEALERHREVRAVRAPGTLDGGDVLCVGRVLHVGRSSRSDDDGIRQLERETAPFGYCVRAVDLRGCLHLKTACTRVGPDTVLLNPAMIAREDIAAGRAIEVAPEEPWAANALWLGGSAVLVDAAWTRTRARLERAGVEVVPVDNRELAKAEGGLTCNSILIDPRGDVAAP